MSNNYLTLLVFRVYVSSSLRTNKDTLTFLCSIQVWSWSRRWPWYKNLWKWASKPHEKCLLRWVSFSGSGALEPGRDFWNRTRFRSKFIVGAIILIAMAMIHVYRVKLWTKGHGKMRRHAVITSLTELENELKDEFGCKELSLSTTSWDGQVQAIRSDADLMKSARNHGRWDTLPITIVGTRRTINDADGIEQEARRPSCGEGQGWVAFAYASRWRHRNCHISSKRIWLTHCTSSEEYSTIYSTALCSRGHLVWILLYLLNNLPQWYSKATCEAGAKNFKRSVYSYRTLLLKFMTRGTTTCWWNELPRSLGGCWKN